jgi:ABC-type multidrug transport system ATPase subunit
MGIDYRLTKDTELPSGGTHDVEEAILLADRVLVLDGGKIAIEERIDLPRARDVGPEFQAIRQRLLGHLGVLKNAGSHDADHCVSERGCAP